MSASTSRSSSFSSDIVRDIFLWRRKKLSFMVFLVVTATWVLLDVYQFNFVTVASWVAMFIVTSLFVYGNLARLFRKEEPNLSGLEISKQAALETANSVREWIEEGIRWMFHVSAEREWIVFARIVAVLWLLSYLGSLFDPLTLLYIGILVGLTVPPIYLKNQDTIRRCGEWMKMQLRRIYGMVDEKVFMKMKNKMAQVTEKKEKKVE